MKKYIVSLCFLVVCLNVPQAFAQDFIAAMQNTYSNMTSFEADFSQELYHRESQHTQYRSGDFYFQKEMFIRWETTEPDEELFIVNPQAVWNYIPDEEIAYKYSADLAVQSHNILSVITGNTPIDRDFEVEVQADVTENGERLHFIKIYPFEPTIDLTEAHVWINAETNYITAAKVYDFYGNTNYIRFNNYRINPSMDTAIFSFTPPAGIDVEDHSNTEGITVRGLTQ